MKSRQSARGAAALCVWLASWTALLCWAATENPKDLLSYDWPSAGQAALAGLLGGILQTVLQLARRGALVVDVLRQAVQDLVFAVGGGIVVYVIIQGISSVGWVDVPRDMRILLIAGVGYSRGAWIALVAAGASDVTARGRKILRGDADNVPSVVAPLEEKK